MRFVLVLLMILFFNPMMGQQQSVEQLRETAITFQRQQDFTNTLMVLGRALEIAPQNLTILKEVAFTYYLGGDFKRAAERISLITDREDADVQVFQIAGNIYKALENWKQSEKLYKKGLKKFPSSGQLFSEYGDLLWSLEKTEQAILQWETGINLDPSHSGNYYHAAKFYFAAADKARSIVYGETFVNLESYSVRTAEIKVLLIESYKRVFNSSEVKKYYIKKSTDFELKFLEILMKQTSLASRGITLETLLVIRSRFILDWFDSVGSVFPFQLFDHQQYLLREGMFEAYNQWLFGPVADVNAYLYWIKTHGVEHKKFQQYQQNKLFKLPSGQHYF